MQRTFTTDELIAWAHIQIPERVFQGQPVDEWYPLNGKEGDGKEGMINLALAYTEVSIKCILRQLCFVIPKKNCERFADLLCECNCRHQLLRQ